MSDDPYLVQSPDNLAEKCSGILRNTLSASGIAFVEETLSEGVEYLSVGAGATQAIAGNRNYKVLPFHRSRDMGRFWIAVVLRFSPHMRNFHLVDISVVLFNGAAQDSEKNPLLRAEWGSTEYYESENHAQPHWHVYPEDPAGYFLERGFLDEAVQVDEFSPETESRGEEVVEREIPSLHLAMAAAWHSGTSSAHRVPISSAKAVNWLEGCIRYMREQIEYAYGA